MNVSPGDLIGPLSALGLYPRKKQSKQYVQDNFTITTEILDEKKVFLSEVPEDPLKVSLVPYGGIEQRPGVDFVVSGNELSWEGLALEILFQEGNVFSVRYNPLLP